MELLLLFAAWIGVLAVVCVGLWLRLRAERQDERRRELLERGRLSGPDERLYRGDGS